MDSETEKSTSAPDYDSALSMGPTKSPGHDPSKPPMGSTPYPPTETPTHTNFGPPVSSTPYPPAVTPTHTNFQPVTLAPSPTKYHSGTLTPVAVPADTQFVPLAVPLYLPLAIISCIFCNCFCLGSVALYNAIRTRKALNNGNVSPMKEKMIRILKKPTAKSIKPGRKNGNLSCGQMSRWAGAGQAPWQERRTDRRMDRPSYRDAFLTDTSKKCIMDDC